MRQKGLLDILQDEGYETAIPLGHITCEALREALGPINAIQHADVKNCNWIGFAGRWYCPEFGGREINCVETEKRLAEKELQNA